MSVEEYAANLSKSLPPSPSRTRIPAIFLAHGSPMLIRPKHLLNSLDSRMSAMMRTMGPDSSHANFLKALGPFLLQRYKPKALLVFSAHWETQGHIAVMDNEQKNELLYDYYNMPDELYKV